LYRSRYERLYPRQSVYVVRGKQEFSCYRAQADDNGINTAAVHAVVAKLNHKLIETRAQFVADCLLDPELDKEPVSIRLVWLQNYVERLAKWAMQGMMEDAESEGGGDTGRTGLFLLQCLYQEEMLKIVQEVEGDRIEIGTEKNDRDPDPTVADNKNL
jgi:hypothetical protein